MFARELYMGFYIVNKVVNDKDLGKICPKVSSYIKYLITHLL